MFWRVGAAAANLSGGPVRAAAVLRAYSPLALAGALSAGMALAPMREGPVRVMKWGRREQSRYLRLPGKVLTVVTPDAVTLYEWTVRGAGRLVAAWPTGSYIAQPADELTELGMRITLDNGKVALLSGPRGITRHAVRHVFTNIAALAKTHAERDADTGGTRTD